MSETGEQRPAEEAVCWRSFPLADDFPRSLLFGAALIGVSVLAGVAFEGLWAAAVAFVLLLVAMAKYVLPTHYRLDDEDVTVRFLGHSQRTSWSRIKRFDVGSHGVFLSPFERPSRLDSFRGVLLRFAGNAAEKIVARGMALPATLFLQSIRPLNAIGSQAMMFLRPFLTGLFFKTEQYDRLAAILERREGLGALVEAVETAQAAREGKVS
ncbi:MAG: hypothetical protein ACYTFO_11460 [Planctomycetota bacterium]